MKRSSPRKTAAGEQERRRKPRKPQEPRREAEAEQDTCSHCGRNLAAGDRALFVEEEIGRTFCTEECIGEFFAPDVERLDAEYHRLLSVSDLSAQEREELAHLRWPTLREPDEVWREKTLTGDQRYALIAEFEPAGKPVWCVCLSLFLRGEPSFLFLSIITRNAALVDRYRRGERMSWIKRTAAERESLLNASPTPEQQALDGTVIPADEMGLVDSVMPTDGLADGWTTDEAVRAALGAERRSDDIPAEEYSTYQTCLEETLQTPDEIWSLVAEQTGIPGNSEGAVRLFHFIRAYPESDPGFWYLIVAKEMSDEEEDHLEVLEAFPTRDPELVERYRQGSQELGAEGASSEDSRVLH